MRGRHTVPAFFNWSREEAMVFRVIFLPFRGEGFQSLFEVNGRYSSKWQGESRNIIFQNVIKTPQPRGQNANPTGAPA